MGITGMSQKKAPRTMWAGLAAGLSLLAFTEKAEAQEILLTGPLAGAPAVRKMRLQREGRFEVAPTVTFSLLDEYQRQIFVGARLNYNFTDWLGAGLWAALSPGPLKLDTDLASRIQDVNASRDCQNPANANDVNCRLTAVNVGPDFTEQLGTIDWIAAPQLTFVPFRGKIAIFQSIYADTDLYFFVGPGLIGVKERGDCGPNDVDCTDPASFARESRLAVTATFGLGFNFYVNKWNAFGFNWRGLPFKRNTGGFDNLGGGDNGDFPDLSVNKDDRQLKFNQYFTVSWGFHFPTMYRLSE